MTPTVIQPCTAMILIRIGNTYEAFDQSDYDTATCGEPVAELGPCQWIEHDDYSGEVLCLIPDDATHIAHELDHGYKGTLKHVTLGSCEECGEAKPAVWNAWMQRGECSQPHIFAPTVTEKDVGHPAERATPPVEEAV